MTSRDVFIRLAHYWKPYSQRLGLGILCLLLASSLMMIQPWILKLAIDDIVSGHRRHGILFYIAGILTVTLAVCCFRFLMRWLIIGVSRHIEADIRREVFEHVLILPKSYFDRISSGDIFSRISNDVLRVRMILGPALMQICNTIISLVFALSFMFVIDVRLTLLSLIPLPLMPAVYYFMGKKIRFHSEKVQEQIAAITSCVQENLTGIRIIKAYNLKDIECRKLDRMSDEYVTKNLNLVRFQGMFSPLMTLLSGLSTSVILLFCGWWVISGRISIGSMVAFLEYLTILSWPLFAIGWVAGLVQQGSAALQRIQTVLDEPPCPGILPGNHDPSKQLTGDIEFRDVSFRYGPGRPEVLKNMSFVIRQGETVAIVGASGSGKTTMMNLINRSYLPTSGSILINGHPMESLPEYSVRESIGSMPQTITLFSDTIENNLTFGSQNPDDAAIQEAIRIASLDQEISEFPEQLRTRLGERGINISGGQKQRLTMARMLLRHPDVMLMDDPFSSVDIATEEAILDKLPPVTDSRTAIIVSHRTNTARRAGRILVVEDGIIREDGGHDALVASNGYYADLCKRQSLLKELESF